MKDEQKGTSHQYNQGTTEPLIFEQPELSDWKIQAFGTNELTFRPRKGAEPNFIHRKFQELILGIKWVKDPL